MPGLSISEGSLEAEICRRDFKQFVRRFWHIIIAEEMVWNWHMGVLCDELQTAAERVFKGQPKLYDLIINVPPGSTKSTIVSIMFPAWCWTRMPSIRTISGSYTDALALDLSRKARIIIKCEKYQQLFGEFAPEPKKGEKDQRVILRDDQDTKTFYETIQGGDRHAISAGADITGFHGHFILVDDPINPKEVKSVAEMKTVSSWMKETLPSRKVDKLIAVTVLIMQRLHEEDPTGAMLELHKAHPEKVPIRHICLPAEESERVRPWRLTAKYTKDEKGHSMLDLARIPKGVCETFKAINGPFAYSGQFEQWPVPPEGGMFKVSMIKLGTPPARKSFWMIVRYWDKAGGEDLGSAETSGTLMAEYREMVGVKYKIREFWVLDVIHGRWDSGERERIIRQTAEADGRDVIVCVEQEPGSGGKESAQDTVRSLAGFVVGKDKVTGNKILRADPFSVQVNQGNVRVKLGAAWWDDYRNQLMMFPFGKLKDMVDSGSGAFAVLTNRVKVGALGR